jgi:hypothetical protein
MEIKVFYDSDTEGNLYPHWMTIDFGIAGVPWDESPVIVDVHGPFERRESHEFGDDVGGLSVFLEELVVRDETLGINLESIYNRIIKHGADPNALERLIIQVGDIEEVLNMGRNLFR